VNVLFTLPSLLLWVHYCRRHQPRATVNRELILATSTQMKPTQSWVTSCACWSIITYKLVFGLTDITLHDYFVPRFNEARRGHNYKLYLPACKSNIRSNNFNYRVIKMELTFK